MSQSVLQSGFLKFITKSQGLDGLLSIVINILMFCSSFGLSLLLFYFFKGVISQSESIVFIGYSILGIVILRFVLTYTKITFDSRIKNRLSATFGNYIQKSLYKADDKPLVSRLISRDFLALLDRTEIPSNIAAYPISLLVGFAAVTYFLGAEAIALLAVTAFIPLSALITKKSFSLVDKIYSCSKYRLDAVSYWLTHRKMLINWKDEQQVINKIESIIDEENGFRNKDSFWRCLDFYSVVFGRVLPVILVAGYAIIFHKNLDTQLLFLLWLSVPFTALIMDFGRHIADVKLCSNAYHELNTNFDKIPTDGCKEIIVDESWDIWGGSLGSNTLINDSNQSYNLLDELRIRDELCSESRHDLNEVYLETGGTNISAGQKTRILVARAIHLAIAMKLPLRINLTLASLDSSACRQLEDTIKDIKSVCNVEVSSENSEFLSHQALSFKNTKTNLPYSTSLRQQKDNSEYNDLGQHSLLNDFKQFIRPLTFLFIVSAFGAGFIGTMAYSLTNSGYTFWEPVSLLLISVALIGFSLAIGIGQEASVRKWAKSHLIMALKKEYKHSIVDMYQRFSKDFLSIVERISWYIHDIAWYVSIVTVTLGALIFVFDLIGLVIAVIFMSFAIVIWRLFAEPIRHARTENIRSTNTLLATGESICGYGTSLIFSPIKELKRHVVDTAMSDFFQNHINLFKLKMRFSAVISCLSGLLIAAIVIPSHYFSLSSAYTAFLLTSVITMDSTVVILFQALSGFNTMRASVGRFIELQNLSDVSHSQLVSKDENGITFNGCVNPITKVKYKNCVFQLKTTYQIKDDSGRGKSQFLKTLVGINNESSILPSKGKCAALLYFDKSTSDIVTNDHFSSPINEINLENIYRFLIEKIGNKSHTVIVLDELLSDYPVENVRLLIQKLSNHIEQTHGILLIVDHRLSLEKQLTVSDFQHAPTNCA